MAVKARKSSKRSLKIKSKREKARSRKGKKKSRKRLAIKVVKLNRTLKRARSIAKKALKTAVKGMDIQKIPQRLYKHIDTAIAKNDGLTTAIQAAIVSAVNELAPKTKTEKPAKAPKAPKAPAEAPAA